MSAAWPGGKGTMMRTGFSGQVAWARCADRGHARRCRQRAAPGPCHACRSLRLCRRIGSGRTLGEAGHDAVEFRPDRGVAGRWHRDRGHRGDAGGAGAAGEAARHRDHDRGAAGRRLPLPGDRRGLPRKQLQGGGSGGCHLARRHGLARHPPGGWDGDRAAARPAVPAEPLCRGAAGAGHPRRAGGAGASPGAGDRPGADPREHRGAVPFPRQGAGDARLCRGDAADHPQDDREAVAASPSCWRSGAGSSAAARGG